jgi:hypothetical protein
VSSPDLKPSELARKIEAEHKGVTVTVQDVSGTLANGEGAITTPTYLGSAILESRPAGLFPGSEHPVVDRLRPCVRG